jgi:hypothetical protein
MKLLSITKTNIMRCEDLRNKFIDSGATSFTDDELMHLAQCDSCTRLLSPAISAEQCLTNAKTPEFNPYLAQKVMNRISRKESSPATHSIRYALVASIVVTLLIGSFTVYVSFSSNHQVQQYDMLSLNDITQTSVIFDK